MRKTHALILVFVIFSSIVLGTDYIKAYFEGNENNTVVTLNDGGYWKSDNTIRFPDEGKIRTECADGSTAFIGLTGTWGWYIKKDGALDVFGKEREEEPPAVFDYDKFKKDESKFSGKNTQYGCEVLQSRKNPDGSCYVVVNTTPEKKSSYDKPGVIEVKSHGYKYADRNLPQPGEKCLVKSVFKGWINYTMNCGTVRFVPLFALDPLLNCFIFVNPNDFIIR